MSDRQTVPVPGGRVYVPRHARRHVAPTPVERMDALVDTARAIARKIGDTW